MRRTLLALAVGLSLALPAAPATAAETGIALPARSWSFDGMFGTYDRAAAQRGFQVYKEVCAACHSMSLVHIRNLEGLGFHEEELKAIAAGYQVTDGPDDNGEMFERPGIPADRFPPPFANDNAARAANNGALPPDLSVIVKARAGGADYIHALLTGYEEAPADMEMNPGMYYNAYFPGHQIAMPGILTDGAVTYADGTEASLDQMAHDVATFLAWTSEPHLEERKATGVMVLLFLLVFTGLLYAVKRKVWADAH